MKFALTGTPIDALTWRNRLVLPHAGAVVVFEGVVRDHHQGRAVRCLDYEAFEPLAVAAGLQILADAEARWPIALALGCHRTGHLEIGDVAVWIGVAAAHRAPAFEACAFIMDEVKARASIWKRETFADGTIEWSEGATLRA